MKEMFVGILAVAVFAAGIVFLMKSTTPKTKWDEYHATKMEDDFEDVDSRFSPRIGHYLTKTEAAGHGFGGDFEKAAGEAGASRLAVYRSGNVHFIFGFKSGKLVYKTSRDTEAGH